MIHWGLGQSKKIDHRNCCSWGWDLDWICRSRDEVGIWNQFVFCPSRSDLSDSKGNLLKLGTVIKQELWEDVRRWRYFLGILPWFHVRSINLENFDRRRCPLCEYILDCMLKIDYWGINTAQGNLSEDKKKFRRRHRQLALVTAE